MKPEIQCVPKKTLPFEIQISDDVSVILQHWLLRINDLQK